MYGKRYMDHQLLTERLGKSIRELRANRGLTQAGLAERAGVTRQKLSQIEKGAGTVAMMFYARVIAALDSQLTTTPAQMPTLEEVGDVFR